MNVVSIDKPTINQMPIVSFPGRIHTIYTASQVPSAVLALRSASIVGFDNDSKDKDWLYDTDYINPIIEFKKKL